MTLDWTTLLLEIINFLVLLWLLQHFLYRPVRAVIARRQAALQKDLAEATDARQQATELQQQYEHRLAAWQQEKTEARKTWQQSLDAEAAGQRRNFQTQLEAEREKSRARLQRELAEVRQRQEQQALAQGGRFAARLLTAVAGPELEARLVDLLLDELNQPAADDLLALQDGEELQISTAFPLDEDRRGKLQQALQQLAGREIHCRFVEDPALLAGVSVQSEARMLGFNLKDELQAFAELLGNDE